MYYKAETNILLSQVVIYYSIKKSGMRDENKKVE
jgi:hypothetical protein